MIDIINQKNAYKQKGIELDQILNKKISIVGLGGLGSHLSESLVRLGFNNIHLFDDDIVSSSNISRQVTFTQKDLGLKKVDATEGYLTKINPKVNITKHPSFINKNNSNLLSGSEIVLDATDNREARIAVNEFCYINDLPWIHATALGHQAKYAAFIPGKTPCYKCLVGPDTTDVFDCNSNIGISITTLMQITSLQLNLMIKILSGFNIPTEVRTLDTFDGDSSSLDFNNIKNISCSLCSNT